MRIGGHEMNYWWVNQDSSYRPEVPDRYLWALAGHHYESRPPAHRILANPSETARLVAGHGLNLLDVAQGDLVFSYADSKIKAIGVAKMHAVPAAEPSEFNVAGTLWGEPVASQGLTTRSGWRVDVSFCFSIFVIISTFTLPKNCFGGTPQNFLLPQSGPI